MEQNRSAIFQQWKHGISTVCTLNVGAFQAITGGCPILTTNLEILTSSALWLSLSQIIIILIK